MQFSKSLRAHFVLSALVALPFASAVHVIFGGTRPVVTTRLDPIVSPGTLGTHEHSVAGGNGFRNTYSYDALTSESTCTSMIIPQDHSNYWTPSMYHQDATNGSLSLMPTSFNIYYLVRGTETGDVVVAPPNGLVMLAGNPNRRVYNASNFPDQAVSFVCLDYNNDHTGDPAWAERPTFFEHQCPDGMRAQVFFPSCWDGQNLDSTDHTSHMAYPVENYNDGHCPPTHPVHIISIFYEMLVSVDQYDYHGDGTWVLSNGDTTGLGFHGDFAMGWTDPGLITSLINDCPNAAGNVGDCPALAAVMDSDAANACRFIGQIVDEPIGDSAPLNTLPGCNPIWEGTGPKPTCPAGTPTPSMIDTQEPLLAGWTNVGCIAEATNARALTSATYTDAVGMTLNTCAAFCGSKGFSYAGIEWSQECYCGNSLSNGATTNTVPAEQCSNACAGNQYMTCGGPQRLTLLFNGNPGAPAPASSSAASSAQPTVKPTSAAPTSAAPTSVKPTSAVPSSVAESSTLPTAHTLVPTSVSVSTAAASSAPAASASASSAPVSPGPNSEWVSNGCIQDSGSARALTGYSTTSNQMTVAMCQSVCDSKGFIYAGLEYGQECYCGNVISGTRVDINADQQCYMTCSDGNKCGGTWAISLFLKTASGSAPTTAPVNVAAPAPTSSPAPVSGSVPSGWTSFGCVRDASSRALNGYSFTSNSMTTALCISTCATKGFTKAGVEFGQECYCGNDFQTNDGQGMIIPDNNCYMHTPNGDNGGGTWSLAVYQTTAVTKRSPKAKHFGRNVAHNHF
ncbi:hypothetical protein EUX98_g2099 [Antrodiella citrinella]|uniref:WSC domain-containing protein n=1 Tax=Antrodiella citrinella TaxID=2447956 RepID=A0A4S4MZW3_9APHY|nr:hypothetical protein EUX98_g2099 [Antrodiella citrinella]